MKIANFIVSMAIALFAQLAYSQIELGDTKMTGGGLFTMGYQGAYGDDVQSNHGLDFGFDGKFAGSYYSPNFLSFAVDPYWNQSRADSDSQSLTGARGVNASANLFTGSRFPGSVSYHHNANSTGTFGLADQPGFTTYGRSDGFGVSWSALLPDLPTLTVGYSQGNGNSTIFGTDQESNSDSKLLNIHSNYEIEGFRLNAFFDHNSLHSEFPQFLSGAQPEIQGFSGQDFGFGSQHNLPLKGVFTLSYVRSSGTSDVSSDSGQGSGASGSSFTDSTETATASIHPTDKFSLNFSQNYTNNLSGYLAQSLGSNGSAVGTVNLGTGSYSSTLGGGASYLFTNFLSSTAQATYYKQHFFGRDYSGEYLSGSVNYGRRLLNTFTFSGSVIESANGQGTNAMGFVGNVNFFRHFGGWQTAGNFSYAQNVQTLLITYTSSYYSYSANVNRRLIGNLRWITSFSGNHSGLTRDAGTNSHSESYSTSLSMRRWSTNAFYTKSDGISLLGVGGPITPIPTPGLTDFILFKGTSYGGGGSVTPLRRLSISGAFGRSISDTFSATSSNNSTELYNAQLQYHLRRIGLIAGYTRFTQGISAIGAPVSATSYSVGISKWFDFF